MSELDVLLRESFGRLAEPGDPTGVVEAVRARVEAAGSGGGNSAGDGGSGATGAGGAAATGSGFWGGWAPLGILIGLSVAGGAGLALATNQPDVGNTSAPVPVSLPSNQGVPASACPGGPPVTELDPGARLLALSQSEDGAFYAVRDPQALGTVVWLAAGEAIVDPGEDPSALPVSGCYEASDIVPIVTEAPPEPEPEPEPAPAPRPRDSQSPSLSVGQFSPGSLDATQWNCQPQSTSIALTGSDNVGITGLSGTANYGGMSVSISGGGGAWTATVTTPQGNGHSGSAVTVTTTFTAVDAAGNSTQASASFTYTGCQ